MSIYKILTISLVILTAVAVVLLILTGLRFDRMKNEPYTLKSYNNTVALYKGEEILEVYDGIVLNNLPITDRDALNKGIDFENRTEAETSVENYDG